MGSSKNSHDDLAMAAVDASSFFETSDCENFIDELIIKNKRFKDLTGIDVDEPKILMPSDIQFDNRPKWIM